MRKTGYHQDYPKKNILYIERKAQKLPKTGIFLKKLQPIQPKRKSFQQNIPIYENIHPKAFSNMFANYLF